MRFPFIKTLFDSFKNTAKRFPFELIFALVGTIAATVNVELSNIDRPNENWCIRVMMTANLGLLLSLSATLFTESQAIAHPKKMYIRVVAAALAVLLLFALDPGNNSADTTRFCLLSLAFHLLVSFAGFVKKGHINGFWQFNKTLFIRFVNSVLYCGVLYLGITAAIAAINFLFNARFESDTFSILFFWITGIFGTVFFLAGVPADIIGLDMETAYPKGLKMFTQYVLIPLATIYLLILLAYEVKILAAWNLPKGYVSYLILGYAVFGILSLLLVYPIREQDENKWLKTYARSFYLLMLPLLLLLFAAVGTRVLRYGITELRYFLTLLAIWLLFISIYFLTFKRYSIKLIPVSLAALTIVSVYGPQSASSVSLYSQRKILTDLFKKNNAFKNGKLIKLNFNKVSVTDINIIEAKLSYLIRVHDLTALQPYMDKDLSAINDSLSTKRRQSRYFALDRYHLREHKLDWANNYLGLQVNGRPYAMSGTGVKAYATDLGVNVGDSYRFRVSNHATNIKSYDYMIDANGVDSGRVFLPGISFKHTTTGASYFSLDINGEKIGFKTSELADSLIKHDELGRYKDPSDGTSSENSYLVPASFLAITKQTDSYRITFFVDNFSFARIGDHKFDPTYVSGYYLIKKMK